MDLIIPRILATALLLVLTGGFASAQDSDPSGDENATDDAPAPAVPGQEEPFTQSIELFQLDFEMAHVPGEEKSGIAPFYMGKTEVTWDIFAPWVQCKDIASDTKKIIARKRELRPSTPYGSIDRDYGYDGRPALGASRLTAQKYCAWLSKQTGRRYRLPTEAEWEHALRLGGNDPDSEKPPENLADIAWSEQSSWNDELFQPVPQLVGTLEPNALGIHDMLGNVAEWVTDTGDERVVRGGSFWTSNEKLSGDDRELEVPEWNENYPNEPKSKWWFVDAEYVGFRLVCEP